MIALLAAVSMVGQDWTMTLMVIAEGRNNWWLAGLLDTVGWLFTLATMHWSLQAVNGGWSQGAILIVGAVSLANFFGTGSATWWGGKHITSPDSLRMERFIAAVTTLHPDVAQELARLEAA